VDVSVVGRHYVHALLAAAAVAEALGCELSTIASALSRARIAERQRVLEGPNERLIIDDAWNASQPSMLAALDVLASVPRRHVAVLGEMLELGAGAEAAHRAVGRRAAEVAEALVTVGEGGLTMADEARRAGLASDAVIAVNNATDVPGVLRNILRSGDAVLVKGSRGLRLERTVEWLLDDDTAGSGDARE
jgi:UDP-N-acetylmuramoyl-tripeptide--D-alanyl-D-alanine ligase